MIVKVALCHTNIVLHIKIYIIIIIHLGKTLEGWVYSIVAYIYYFVYFIRNTLRTNHYL